MTQEEKEILDRINSYANAVLADINPQKTPVSYQLEKLKPIMEILALEKKCTVEEIFILYMDLASSNGAEKESEFQKVIHRVT